MLDNREQHRKILNIIRNLRDDHDLVPFITLKYLSQKQEESKDNLGEFIDEYGFYFRDYELLSNIFQKQENDDDSYLSDFKSSINALKNASNEYIKEIYSRIPNKTLTDDVLTNIIIVLKFYKDSRRLYLDLTSRTFMVLRRTGNIVPPIITRIICDIIKEDHEIKHVYNPKCRDAESLKLLGNFESATLYESDENMYFQAIQNMIINNIPLDKINITNKEIIVDESTNMYDAIISIPHEVKKTRKRIELPDVDKFKDYITRNPDSLHLLNLIDHLSEDGILITIMSPDLLVKRDAYNLRKCLIDRNILDSIIEYDKSYRNDMNIMLIIKKNKKSEDILFYKEHDDIHHRHRIHHPRTIMECYQERTKIDRLSDIITNEEIMENDYNLNPKRYVYTLDYEPKDLGELTSEQQEYTSQIRQLDGEIEELLDKISKL